MTIHILYWDTANNDNNKHTCLCALMKYYINKFYTVVIIIIDIYMRTYARTTYIRIKYGSFDNVAILITHFSISFLFSCISSLRQNGSTASWTICKRWQISQSIWNRWPLTKSTIKVVQPTARCTAAAWTAHYPARWQRKFYRRLFHHSELFRKSECSKTKATRLWGKQ